MEILDSNFEELTKEGLVLVDFYADWCGPCKMLSPIIDKLTETYKGKASIYKMNTDKSETVTDTYEICSLPTLLFFKDGEVVEKLTGFQSEETISKILESL